MSKLDILDIETNLLEKKISIYFNLDIEESTVTKRELVLIQYDDSKRNYDYDIEVDGKSINLILKEWPLPNTPYLLKIHKGIKSITDDELSASFKDDIIFKSNITNTVKIITPANMEKIDKINFSWKEEGLDEVNSYLIEVSKDNIFFDTVISTVTVNKNISFDNLANGQYYARIRTQKDTDYGAWSDIVTFIYEKKKPVSFNPIFEQDLEILGKPEMCETPESFIFEFDDEINDDDISEDNFLIIRRDF